MAKNWRSGIIKNAKNKTKNRFKNRDGKTVLIMERKMFEFVIKL